MITIIYGPAGSGKTKNAQKFMKYFNAKRLVDEWPEQEITDGDLILTQKSPPFNKLGSYTGEVRAIPIQAAISLIGVK